MRQSGAIDERNSPSDRKHKGGGGSANPTAGAQVTPIALSNINYKCASESDAKSCERDTQAKGAEGEGQCAHSRCVRGEGLEGKKHRLHHRYVPQLTHTSHELTCNLERQPLHCDVLNAPGGATDEDVLQKTGQQFANNQLGGVGTSRGHFWCIVG